MPSSYGQVPKEKPPPKKDERGMLAFLFAMPCLGFCLHFLIAMIVLILIPFAPMLVSSSSSSSFTNATNSTTNSSANSTTNSSANSTTNSSTTNATNSTVYTGPSPPSPPAPPMQPTIVKIDANCINHLTELECRTKAFNIGWQLSVSSSTTTPHGCTSNPILNGVYFYNTNEDSTATCQGNINLHCHCGLDGVWNQRGGDMDGEAEYDQSGRALAISNDGTIVAIGAYGNDGETSLMFSGHVRVYKWTSGAWVQRGEDIDGQAAHERFGFSVALSADGTVMASGSYKDDTTSGADSGSVRVFIWDAASGNGGAWVQRGATLNGEAASDFFGWEVDLSHDGDTLAVSGYYNDGGASSGGHVRIFKWDGGSNNWVQRGSDLDGITVDEKSGYGIALSATGDTVVIGAPWNEEAGTNAGQVRIYDWSAGSNGWVKRGMSINGEAANDNSGKTVAVSDDGKMLAISAKQNDGAATNAGHVRIFHWDGSAWVQRGADIDGEAAGDTSGAGIAMDSTGNIIAIGATANDGNGQNAGHVRIFKWDTSTGSWNQVGDDIDGEAAFDASGIKVKLSGDGRIVAIGAYGNDEVGSSSGHVRVYELQ